MIKVEAKEVTKHSIGTRQLPTTKNCLSPDTASAEVENPGNRSFHLHGISTSLLISESFCCLKCPAGWRELIFSETPKRRWFAGKEGSDDGIVGEE